MSGYAQQNDNFITAGHRRFFDLASRFPTLRGVPGMKPWDAYAFARFGSTLSGNTSQGQCAAFLLSVWNNHGGETAWFRNDEYNVPQFDPVRALMLWDDLHIAIFNDWCSDPFWP